jgi:UDP-N-acetylmuramate: L-alanyl-gamma-D-glutamyl-meso-diaminopimelate ligase
LGEDRISDFQASGIEQFRGVQRRQQIRLETDRLIAIEDFAHHPTAIKEILESVRARYPNSRLIAAFEPRSNTSRLEIMRAPLCEALSQADAVVIGAAKKSPYKYNEIMNTEALASDLNAAGIAAIANLSNEASLKALIELCADDSGQQLVVFLTNGSFDGIIGQFVDHCLRGSF